MRANLVHTSIDFEDLVSLRGVVLLNIFNRVSILIRYLLHHFYLKDSIIPFIERVSSNLMLVNLVDRKGIGFQIWNDCYEKSVNMYFFYFIIENKDNYEYQIDKSTGVNTKFGKKKLSRNSERQPGKTGGVLFSFC